MIPFVAFSNYKSTNRLGYSDNLVQNSTLECGLAMLLYYNTLNNMTMGSIARLFNDKQCKSIFVHITVVNTPKQTKVLIGVKFELSCLHCNDKGKFMNQFGIMERCIFCDKRFELYRSN